MEHPALIPNYGRYDLRFVAGTGAYLIADDGQKYLDFSSGVAVNILGYGHQKITDALKAQIDKIWHCSNLYHIPLQEELAEMLVANSFASKAFFCNSGLEANEAMVKLARRYHYNRGDAERVEIITLEGSFHGRSLAMLAATGKQAYLQGMGPVAGGFVQVPRDNLSAIRHAISDKTAAIMVEPILGEGGIYELKPDYLQALRALADENEILLLLDEVQTGVGRTGDLWAHQYAKITPDAMSLAKALGAGFPVAALLANQKTANALTAGTHGCTFGGNYLAMAVGKAVLEIVCEDDFLNHVKAQGDLLTDKLQQLCQQFPEIFIERAGAVSCWACRLMMPIRMVI